MSTKARSARFGPPPGRRQRAGPWLRNRPHAARRGALALLAAAAGVAAGAAGLAGCGGSPAASAPTTPTSPARASTPTTAGGPLVAPKTDPVVDGQFLTEVAEADPDLSSYVTQEGNVALQALLTDGSAFCAFLARGGGVDQAMVSLAEGARSVESKTHLPSSVTTFNTIDAVALLTLCPSELHLVPPGAQARIKALGATLAGHTSSLSSPAG